MRLIWHWLFQAVWDEKDPARIGKGLKTTRRGAVELECGGASESPEHSGGHGYRGLDEDSSLSARDSPATWALGQAA